jgi:HK97 family phage major capsid protein
VGAYIVPEHLRGPIISYIIENGLLGRLEVKNIAVETDTTKFAETTVLNVANTIAEGAELTETDITLVPRTLQTFTYRSGTILSQELIDDAIEYPGVILEPLMQSIAENISSDFVNGAGSSEPMGLSNMTGMYTRYHMGVNGAVLTNFASQEYLWRKLRELNQNVSAFVMAPRTLGAIKLLETATEKVQLPNIFPEIPNVETNAVSITETEGAGENCSSIYGGDFENNVLCGWRYGGGPDSFRFIVDPFTLGEYLKVRVYCYTRMGIAYPRGYGVFGRIKGILKGSTAIT